MSDPFLLLVISSPSGTGKTTLCRKLLREFPWLRFSVSTTTRAPRDGEIEGTDYNFVSRERFGELISSEAFIEWAEVHGNRYGTTWAQIDIGRSKGTSVIFDVDVQGAARIKNAHPESAAIFLLPPSLDELESRIRGRGTESEEQVELRLANARREIEHAGEFDYLVVNDVLEDAYDRLRAIVVAEASRTDHQQHFAEQLLQ